jgi:uncharacterized phage protein (TIGR02218 family)
MDSWLAGPVTSVVYGWRLERGDGVTLGFTSHDRAVVHDGLLLRASPGMKPSTIVASLGLEIDGLDVEGALSSDAISTADLEAGRWNAAYLEIFLFDWAEPSAGRRLLAAGTLGSVSFSGDAFKTEFVGLKNILSEAVVPQTSPSCRAAFCGSECGLSRIRFSHVATVTAVTGNRIALAVPLDVPTNGFAHGNLRWLAGPRCGLVEDIWASDGTGVTLAHPLEADGLGATASNWFRAVTSRSRLARGGLAMRSTFEASPICRAMTCLPDTPVQADVGELVAAQASALLGVPYRFRGRNIETGLDCIGAVVEAFSGAGICVDAPYAYTFRGDFRHRIDAFFDRADFAAINASAYRPGDILLCEAGPRQLHFGIFTVRGLVHAHAGLGRVVLTPWPLPWPIAAGWRHRRD